MRILFVGDIYAEPGVRTLEKVLGELRSRTRADLVVANGENASRGFGLTVALYRRMIAAGVDVVTTGNHVYDRWEITEVMERDGRIVRPANFAPGVPGVGFTVARTGAGPIAVVNLVGRVFMDAADCPFRTADEILDELDPEVKTILVDFHAEATSEKQALGHHLDGRVTAVVGTHTHVPTADAHVLPGGTGYVTDVGMTGVTDSVIGSVKEMAVRRFRTGLYRGLPAAEGKGTLMGVLVEADGEGRCRSIHRVDAPEP